MTTTAGYAPTIPFKEEPTSAPLRLGPIVRSKTMTDSIVLSLNNDLQSASSKVLPTTSEVKYPRIVVKDPIGRTLDTFTTLQEAIYRASWTRKKMGEWPKTPFEWRLPKAPVPSRPDYSRAAPRLVNSVNLEQGHLYQDWAPSHSHDVTSSTRRIDLTTNVLVHVPTVEIPVDDVAFVAESLNHLPSLPSFSFLRQSILAGQSTYIQIVASILLHQRELRATEHRVPEWEFPGFCTGCKRAGFCYGCSKNPKPHIHEDIPARIGGGFRFWKRDRPHDPHNWKHPSAWRLPSTDQELRNVIEEYGGLSAYEQAVLRAKREMARSTLTTTEDDSSRDDTNKVLRFHRLKNLGSYPPFVTIISTDDYGKRKNYDDKDDAEDESSKTRFFTEKAIDEKEEDKMVLIDEENQRSQLTDSRASEESVDRTLVRVDTGYFEDMADEDMKDDRSGQGKADSNEKDDKEEDYKRSRDKSRTQTSFTSRERSESTASPIRSTAAKTSTAGRLNYVDKEKEFLEEEAARLRRERANQNVPFGTKRDDVDYKAPKFFLVQKQSRKITVSKAPFSTDRELNVPKGPSFQLKKSEKKTTKFVDFKRSGRGWEAPKKFEIKHENKLQANSLTGKGEIEDGKRRKKQEHDKDGKSRRRRLQDLSPDSGLDCSTAKDKENIPEFDKTDAGDSDGQGNGEIIDQSPAGEGQEIKNGGELGEDRVESPKPKRREIMKKTQAEVVTPPLESPSSPPLPTDRITTPPVPSPPQSLTPAAEEPPLPEIDIPTIPDLPEIGDKAPGKKKEKHKSVIELPAQLLQVKEEPKKRRAAPKVRVIPKNLYRARRSCPAQAFVTSEELMDISDPLDFLARWCIINPDRLPFYEIVFESIIADQTPPYTQPIPSEQREAVGKEDTGEELKQVESEEKKTKQSKSKKWKENENQTKINELKPNLFPAERGMNVMKATMTVEEQHLEKLIYTLDLLQDKMLSLGDALEELEDKRIKVLASKARETFPQIASPNYIPHKKKGKKGKKKNKQLSEKLKPHEITDEVIVARLDGKMLAELCREQDMKFLESEIEILREKIREVQRRVEKIASEKLLTDAFCMNHYFLRQGIHSGLPEDFKRQQSELYNRLHPTPDFEMNLEEVEEALQQINNHLLTKNEFHFLYNILNLPGREKINFRLFTVIAALSEKVTQLDPVIRKMINNFDYNALDTKMEKCKELFDLLDMDHMPQGTAQAESLAVELTAGGLRPDHTKYVLNKFNRESKGAIDFLDFVTYIPLFVEIHKRIIQDPLKEELDL